MMSAEMNLGNPKMLSPRTKPKCDNTPTTSTTAPSKSKIPTLPYPIPPNNLDIPQSGYVLCQSQLLPQAFGPNALRD